MRRSPIQLCKSQDFIQEVFEGGVYYKNFLAPKVAPMSMPMRSQEKQSVSIRAGVLDPRFERISSFGLHNSKENEGITAKKNIFLGLQNCNYQHFYVINPRDINLKYATCFQSKCIP